MAHRASAGVRRPSVIGVLFAVLLAPGAGVGQEGVWIAAGAAKVDITPELPALLAGYAARTSEHEGVDARIFARALAMGAENPVLLIAVENCGVPAALVKDLKGRLSAAAGLRAERIVVSSTHTHCAPTLAGYAPIIWQGRAQPEAEERTAKYTARLGELLVQVADEALRARRPARLGWAQGRVSFGGNRRVVVDGRWRGFGFAAGAPVDHSLPVLAARGADGAIIALWTAYACHATTLGARNRISGDWAGFASAEFEARHPGAVALATIGCGADVGPVPSGGLAEAQAHGREVADEAARLVAAGLTPLSGVPDVVSRSLDLPFASPPSREELEERARKGGFAAEHARALMRLLDQDGRLPAKVELPLAVWTFGSDLAIVFLGGEVVVDYAVRLKRELDWRRLWINGWSDDVPCYIPSRRVLDEGGYEADESMVYYARPARFSPLVETIITGAVTDLLAGRFGPDPAAGPSPFHTHPGADLEALAKGPELSDVERVDLRQRTAALWRGLGESRYPVTADEVRSVVAGAVGGYRDLVSNDGELDAWHDFTGRRRFRPFIRQLHSGAVLRWRSDPAPAGKTGTVTLAFAGGLGWKTEPATEGFALDVDGRELVRFDVTLEPRRWTGAGGAALLFVPTWTSDLDAGGFFFLTVPAGELSFGKPALVAVRSLASGSRRWFALDVYRDAAALARSVLAVDERR